MSRCVAGEVAAAAVSPAHVAKQEERDGRKRRENWESLQSHDDFAQYFFPSNKVQRVCRACRDMKRLAIM